MSSRRVLDILVYPYGLHFSLGLNTVPPHPNEYHVKEINSKEEGDNMTVDCKRLKLWLLAMQQLESIIKSDEQKNPCTFSLKMWVAWRHDKGPLYIAAAAASFSIKILLENSALYGDDDHHLRHDDGSIMGTWHELDFTGGHGRCRLLLSHGRIS
jgi:hypothetical protein